MPGRGFNPRICKRCDLNLTNIISFLICFNPRICKRCDGVAPLVGLTTYVSIHASVKDATFRNVNAYQRYLVSIHASVKDATHADDVPDPDKNVSIHASVKDATKRLSRYL